MRQKILVFILIFILGLKAQAQDPQFSQYYAMPLNLNPALAGGDHDFRLNAIHRSQWRSIAQPYVTNQISLIAPLHSKNLVNSHIGGAGLSVYNDRSGEGNFKILGINASLAYNVYLSSDNMISFGLQGGIIQKKVDVSNLEWGSTFTKGLVGTDPSIPAQGDFNTKALADAGAGFVWYHNKLEDYKFNKTSSYLGFSVYHLNTPNESLVKGYSSKLPRLFKLHSGLEVQLSEKLNISPNILALYQNQLYQINTGFYVTYRTFADKGILLTDADIIFGTWYRYKDAFIFSTGLNTKYYTIGFSYDLNNSSLRYSTQGRGAYEISLSICKPTHRSIRRFGTPRI